MKFIIGFIFMLCGFILYVVRCVGALCQGEIFYKKLDKAARKALRCTLRYGALLGFIMLFLANFELFSVVGYWVLPDDVIHSIRDLLERFLHTRSVREASEILVFILLLTVEFSLIFACIGLFLTKGLVLSGRPQYTKIEKVTVFHRVGDIKMPRAERHIFLNFARLII